MSDVPIPSDMPAPPAVLMPADMPDAV